MKLNWVQWLGIALLIFLAGWIAYHNLYGPKPTPANPPATAPAK